MREWGDVRVSLTPDQSYLDKVTGRMLVPVQGSQMTYLTDRQVAQNLICKGDIVLRWHDTLWAEKIVRPVDVADGALSPLGQIFGNYDEGLKVLSLTNPKQLTMDL